MKKQYSVALFNICTFSINEVGIISTNLNEYPITRLCVIDADRSIVIDVNHELKYDYLQTSSRLYFLNKVKDRIKDNRRFAINLNGILPILSDKEILKIEKIKKKLDSGYDFVDGNDFLSNEEYKKKVKEESILELKNKQKGKTKYFSKRKIR